MAIELYIAFVGVGIVLLVAVLFFTLLREINWLKEDVKARKIAHLELESAVGRAEVVIQTLIKRVDKLR
jgi:hypothetical protein